MKKLFALFILMFVLIVGCSNKEETQNKEEAKNQEEIQNQEVQNTEQQESDSKDEQAENDNSSLDVKGENNAVEKDVQKKEPSAPVQQQTNVTYELTEEEEEQLNETLSLVAEIKEDDKKYQQIINDYTKRKEVEQVNYEYTDEGIVCEISFNSSVSEEIKKKIKENLRKEFKKVDDIINVIVIEK